jgi:hypothetical protein
MANCECLPKCLFFNDKMNNQPATAEMMKKRFCLGDNSCCARYVIFKQLGREKVPSYLYPNQMEKALAILVVES